jgi:hypothetical protein
MKLFVQEFEDKFINNVSLIKSNNFIVVNDEIDGNLYQIHYKYNFDAYIFVSSLMTNEIYQYILEFNTEKKIILYHDRVNADMMEALGKYCVNIGPKSDMDSGLEIPILINNDIFFNTNKKRNKYIPCFIDNASTMNNELYGVLYPNKNFNIRIFGSSSIKHPQNVGLLSEQDRADILNEAESCLLVDDLYLAEAMTCGTKILRPKNGQLIEDTVSLPENIETYGQFLDRILKI